MPQAKTAQEAFLGLFTEATPEGLPQGASPRALNCDYIVGSVGPRPGKQSFFTYSEAFIEAMAAFSHSVGTGAAWSGGSVTLNNAPAAPPVRFNGVLYTRIAIGPSSLTYARSDFYGDLAGPVITTLPFLSQAAGISGELAWVTSITDNAGGTWTELTGHTQWSGSGGSTAPGVQFNYQYWVGVFPLGLPQSIEIVVTYNVNPDPFTGQLSMTSSPSQGGVFQNVSGFEHYGFTKIAPTPGVDLNGPPVTTTGTRVLVVGSNIKSNFVGVTSIPSVPVNVFQTGSSSQAVYGNFTEPAGTYQPVWHYNQVFTPPWQDTLMSTIALIPAGGGTPTGDVSQIFGSLNFGLNVPLGVPGSTGKIATGCGDTFHFIDAPAGTPILGLEVVLTGNQTDLSPDTVLTVQLKLPDGTLSNSFNVQLPLTTGTVTVGGPLETWGVTLTPAIVNDPNFEVDIVAHAPGGGVATFTFTAAVEVKVNTAAADSTNYLKSFEQSAGELESLVLGSNGVLYHEDAINAPDVLTPLFTRIFPDSYAQSVTQDNREYIAFSDLEKGTDIPRVYSPPNFDRLSQVGPGAAPAATGSNAGGTIPIVSITQPPVQSDPENPGHISGFLWSAGPGSTSQGNVLTVYYARTAAQPVADPDLKIGVGVTIAGADTANPNNQFNGQTINGNYIVTSLGSGIPPGAQYERWYFTVPVTVSQFVNQANHIEANAPDGTYQVTTATLTASSPVPNMQVGSSMQIAGTGGGPPAGYDGKWLVTDTLNAADMQIVSTQLIGNVAAYSYTIPLISGVAPVVGSKVTVSGTLNGQGIFNVSNATITSASPGTFSINLTSPDIPFAAEDGIGIVLGTIFKFEPGKVVGTKLTGSVVVVGTFSSGKRKVCYSFLTRNGFLTQPSPIFEADITIGSTGIAVSNLAIGPPNVVARVLHFTGANGGQFYNIPDPVIVIDPVTGQKIVNDSTWIMDNTTTNVVLSFSDETLLAADEIDIQGNNLFNCYELGACIGFIPYAGRLAAVGEQNKVFNFRNHSFDGGVSVGGIPLGWVSGGAGGSAVNSPIFGWAYQIANTTGSPQAVYGLLTQPAYKDEFQVDIINASTTYSVRVTAAVLAPVASGNLVIDLYSASSGGTVGSYTLPLNLLTTTMQLFSGTLLTNMLAPVPQDLQLRIYATNIPNGATVLLDREEVFPTEAPNLDKQVILSYAQNFEAFDRVTGILDPSLQNTQPIRSGYVQFDTLYLAKTNSLVATNDNGTTEPTVGGGGWNIRTVSQSVGTLGIYGVTTAINQPNSGEDWAIIAGRAGAYIHDGGEPVKLSEEIQSIWNQVNWEEGAKNWVLNDITNRRVLFGVCLRTWWLDPYGRVTRGTWLPEGVMPDDPMPVTPNVILELNYKQLNTANALSSSVGVHRTFSGKLIASEITRKWALWTIKAPAAAFLTRPDGSAPVFLGNSDHNGKVFQLIEGLLEDDGSPFAEIYCTSSFLPRQEAQAQQVGVLRYGFDAMTLIIDGFGTFRVTVMPNYVDGAGTHALLPDLTFPVATYGDAEVPVDEEANRLFVQFGAQCVGSGFILSGMVMVMSPSAFAPFSGRNG